MQAYFCSGDPYWALNLDDHENNAIFKGLVIMAHYQMCYNFVHGKLTDYKSRMTKAVTAGLDSLQKTNLTATMNCLKEKLPCLAFENLCGTNKLWNFREMLKFFHAQLSTKDSSNLSKMIASVLGKLLEGKNADLFLTTLDPFCSTISKYCKKKDVEERNAPIDSLPETLNLDDGNILRRKRAFDPVQMMGLFNKVTCNEKIMIAIAEYFQKHYVTLPYSRVWTTKNFSVLWCCLAGNLEELYHQTPDE